MAENNIGFWGGMALLISSITGPGLTTIPLLFQQAGWLTPIIAFLLFGVISGLASLFLVETMSTIRGNESFEANVEYSTVAHLYLGKKAHIGMQILLFLALQSVNVSSIVISNQTMDSLLIRLFHKTCAVSFTEGWVCATEVTSSGSPFDSYILFSFGYLISAAMVLPLSVMSLVQNIKFQIASVATLFFVLIIWIYLFAHHGLDNVVPPVGNNQSTLVGFVLGNFAFITTIPSFINELSRSVSIHRTIIYPLIVCIVLYVIIGLMGAASFNINSSSSILATLGASNENKVLTIIVDILFPVAVLVTSVPVFSIVIRYNLVRGNLCSNRYAILWASVLPWLLIIPFQTKGWLVLIMNWTSLIFGSTTNFIIPLVLFLSSKVYSASTADATGGDVFILQDLRPNSVTSRLSSRSSSLPRQSLHVPDIRSLPRLTTTLEPPNTTTYDTSTTPRITLDRSPRSPASSISGEQFPFFKNTEDVDITEQGESSVSNPLRVIYSPTVSRRPTISSASRSPRPSSSSARLEPQNNDKQSKGHSPTTSVSFDGILSSDTGDVRRRRNSTITTGAQALSPDTRVSLGGGDNRPRSISSLSIEASQTEPPTNPHFLALMNRKWLRPTIVARCCLAIVSLCVLGNVIYTIVESAEGNSPLSS